MADKIIEHIEKNDSLNKGRVKINDALQQANDVASESLEISERADDKATEALGNSESTQTQLDTIVIDGDSSVEAAQARVNADGIVFSTLKARLDSDHTSLSEEIKGIDNYTTVTHHDEFGDLQKVEILEGSSLIKEVILTYNLDKTLSTVSEKYAEKTVVSTLNYEDGEFISLTKEVFEGGI